MYNVFCVRNNFTILRFVFGQNFFDKLESINLIIIIKYLYLQIEMVKQTWIFNIYKKNFENLFVFRDDSLWIITKGVPDEFQSLI